MPIAVEAVRAALASVDRSADDDVFQGGKATALRLCNVIEANQAGSEIAEVHNWAFHVEFVLKNGEYWAIECLSPTAFRMYPGVRTGDTVAWANVWVRGSDLTLGELVEWVNQGPPRRG
jgi:hypothetical protein